jgi:hypothetical protein
MRKFSEIPEFILDNYVTAITDYGTDSEPILTEVKTSNKFMTENLVDTLVKQIAVDEQEAFRNHNVLFRTTSLVGFNILYISGELEFRQSKLSGPLGQNIITTGGNKIVAFAKTDDEYKEIELHPYMRT